MVILGATEIGGLEILAMAKRPTKRPPETHSRAVYHIKGTPAELVGIIDDAPDEQAAIERPIGEYRCR